MWFKRMGFLDLSTNVASKKHVDFNDARYQLSEKLKQSENKNIRATFTLYDNKEYKKTAVQDITAAYALSDKRLPIGELLNKMVDLVLDMEDGILDTEKDAIYAWKYSMALLEMFEDKSKRQDTLFSFDNSLKTSILNSKLFTERYPGKYIPRTNFFDQKVKEGLINDVVETFKEVALPGIHESAIKQSKRRAEEHYNPVLDKIVMWAKDSYKCEVESFFDIQEDKETGLFFSINTIIAHLKNGYDMSIVGYVGTEYDDKFALSVLDTQKITIQRHGEHISQKEIQDVLDDASKNDPINPMGTLLDIEKKKNDILKKQYEILADIRPMIPKNALKLKAAESVVGVDYIWGCEKFRETHDDLPANFKVEDIILPELIETEEELANKEKEREFLKNFNDMTISMDAPTKIIQNSEKEVDNSLIDNKSEDMNDKEVIGIEIHEDKIDEQPIVEEKKTADDMLKEMDPILDLFSNELPVQKTQDLGFADEKKNSYVVPILNFGETDSLPPTMQKEPIKEKEFSGASTLLPGFIPTVKKEEVKLDSSATGSAQPMPQFEKSLWKDEETKEQQVKKESKPTQFEESQNEPELLLDDLDSLFE